MEKEETLKDWVKGWSTEDIVGNVFAKGMEFMAREIKQEVSDEYQRIIVKELKSRMTR